MGKGPLCHKKGGRLRLCRNTNSGGEEEVELEFFLLALRNL